MIKTMRNSTYSKQLAY